MEYLCYISRNKIDQLYDQLDPEGRDERKEIRTTETNLGADAHVDWNVAHILSLFKGGLTYGRKGVIQYEAKLKTVYVEKLHKVLINLAENRPIPSLEQAISSQDFSSLYYHHAGRFRLEHPLSDTSADTLVTLRTAVAKRRLLLDCSLRNFSEGPLPDGTFSINSSNQRFFTGDIQLTMATVFALLDRNSSRIVGTPLFLRLSVEAGALSPAL